MELNTCCHSPVLIVHTELCAVQCRMCCVLFRLCVFYHVPTTGKRKCKFIDELKSKYSRFRNSCVEYEAECLVCKAGTYVPVTNKGALDLRAHVECEKHKKAVRGEMSLAKVTSFFHCIRKQIRCCCVSGRRWICILYHETSQKLQDSKQTALLFYSK